MNRLDLKKELDELNISPRVYSLFGEVSPDTIIIDKISNNRWEVYYFDEKGNRDTEKEFQSEHDACVYLYVTLKDY